MSESNHKFVVGSYVKLHRTIRGVPIEGNVYEVTRTLPPENNDFQYRLRTLDGRGERVAFESELIQSSVAEQPAPVARPAARRL